MSGFLGYKLNSFSITFGDLPGTAVGETTGNGATASITLDTTGAGHNWYVDATPLDNTDDFLPTADPTIWRAKAGSAADGKMDMLSVLLHEYGHALGLSHSADSGDFMAATLQPGERRLPSADELQLMSELVAGLKGDAPTPALPQGGREQLPLGALLLGRLALGRRPEDAVAQGSQALFAAHPTLQGGSLQSLQDWATTGSVTAASGGADGATLQEGSATQTRLNQVFMVGPNDRYLSFTLSNLALDDAANGPDDAFEVGLLNANTGADLMGAIGLSRTDALLNLQANGTEHAAQGVSHITHADGSRTYLVDLAGIARNADGTVAVNLSFDLIGFAGVGGFGSSTPNLGSHVTVSNVRLFGQPQTNDDVVSGAEDAVLHIAALANDLNADLAGLAPVLLAGPAHGTVVGNADGSFSYTPDGDYFGADSFTYRVSNGTLASNVATVSITVTAVNDAPMLGDQVLTTAEDTVLTGDLLATAADVDVPSPLPPDQAGGGLSPAGGRGSLAAVLVAGPLHGDLSMNADGTFSYQPAADFNGSDSFSYTVNDGEIDSNVATVFITVTAVNDAPTLGDQTLSIAEDTVLTGSLLATAADVDGTSLAANIVAGPLHGGLVVNADGSFSYTPDANYFGADSFTYRVNDGDLDSNVATVSLTITPVNDAPLATAQVGTLQEDGALTISLLASASDVDGDTLSTRIVAAPQHGRLQTQPDGSVGYLPDADFNGDDSFTYLVSDGQADSNVATVNLTITPVNDAPVLADASAATQEDRPVTLDLLAHASDVDGDDLRLAIWSGPAHGTLTANADGSYSYLAAANYNGQDSFSYVVNDGQVNARVATVSISIAAVNDAPVASDASSTTNEDTALRIDLRTLGQDVEGAALAPVIVNGPAHGVLNPNGDGTYSYLPAANYFGADAIRFALQDSEGGLSNEATLSITVAAVNDVPTLGNQSLTSAEDTVLTGNLLATAADVDMPAGGGLAATLIEWPLHGALAVNADGTFSYTPTANYYGSDSFTYRVNDGVYRSTVATVSLTITPVNDVPVAVDASSTTNEDTALRIDLRTLGQDVEGGALTPILVTGPAHGVLNLSADGSYSYLPAANYFGADAIRFALRDSEGALSNEATLSINVNPVNDAPTLGNQALTTAEDTPLTGDLLATALDVDMPSLQATPAGGVDASGGLTAVLVAGPLHGALNFNADGTFSYMPAANYFGADSFTYRVSDGTLSSSVATLSLTITAVNDAPVATNDTASVIQGQSIAINVLANDSDVDSDVDSAASSLRPSVLTQPAHGTAVVNANGTISYTPVAGYAGSDSFSYTSSDGQAQSNAASVSITVTPNVVNHPPVFISSPPLTITLGGGGGGGTGTGTGTGSADSVFLPTNQAGRITTNYRLTGRAGSYANEVGYYRVDDASGRIGNLLPGDAGYAQAALAASRATTLFSGQAGTGANAAASLVAGQHVGFYLIQNASISSWRAQNSGNSLSQTPLAFFSFQAANPDGLDHLHGSFANENANNASAQGKGKLTLAWEEATNGGDKDFDDVVLTATGFKAVGSGNTGGGTGTGTALFSYDANATDADGDTLSYSLSQAPQGATINVQTGVINWTATAAGNYSFTVNAADGKGGVAVQSFTLAVIAAGTSAAPPIALSNAPQVSAFTSAASATFTTASSASIVVTSSPKGAIAPSSKVAEPPIHYLVINSVAQAAATTLGAADTVPPATSPAPPSPSPFQRQCFGDQLER